MQRIVLLAALNREIWPLIKHFGSIKCKWEQGLRVHRVHKHGVEILLVETGMGLRRAEIGARLVLDRFKPELAISCGFGGGLTTDLLPGAVIQAERVVLYNHRNNTLEESLELLCPEIRIMSSDLRPGTVVTTTHPPDKKALSLLLPTHFHPAVVDMETYHTARIFLEAQVAFLSLRSVCDEQDFDPDLELERLTDGFGQINSFKACAYCLRHPGKIIWFLSLAKRSALAAKVLCRLLEEVFERIEISSRRS